MGKLYNYGDPIGKGGWEKLTSLLKADSAEKYIISDLASSERPNIAIPSPYARMELYRAAFKYVANKKGDEKYYYSLVSDVLDVLQYIFEGKEDGIKITSATLGQILEDLSNAGSDKNRSSLTIYSDVLKSYAKSENFGLSDETLLFFFVKGKRVLAMTSPSSILIPTSDARSSEGMCTEGLKIEGSIPLFTKSRSLKERDIEFITYIIALYDRICKVDTLKDFADYIAQQKKEINFDGEFDLESYSTIEDSEGNEVFAPGEIPIRKLNPDSVSDRIAAESDLVLKPSKPYDFGHSPLVLTTNNTKPICYTTNGIKWNSKSSGLDYNDETIKERPIEKRKILPNGIAYNGGFVYDHDFLSDIIIRVNYPLSKDFFDGNTSLNKDERGFIPPITEEYFKYFDKSDLKKQMKIEVKSKSVIVTLSLPTSNKNSKITIKKTYLEPGSNDIAITERPDSRDEAKGYIFSGELALSLFPKIRFAEKSINHYVIQTMVGEDIKPYALELTTLLDTSKGCSEISIPNQQIATVRKQIGLPNATNYCLEGDIFDFIKISLKSSGHYALLIPTFGDAYNGRGSSLSFGFDFGSSNSFVAVEKDNYNGEREFIEFTLPCEYLATTYDGDYNNTRDNDRELRIFRLLTAQSFFPRDFKGNPFPTATLLAESKDAHIDNYTQSIPFLKSTIPFMYGRGEYGEEYFHIHRNLKWFINGDASNTKIGKIRAANYIKELVMLAQLFAAQQGADLSDCKITWTYPLSMSSDSLNIFDEIWENAYKSYFGSNNRSENVKSFTESMAPMIYYSSTNKIDYTGVSIDIGGGTCDIVLIPEGEESKSMLASIGFGADCIFAVDNCLAKDIKMFRYPIDKFTEEISKSNINDTYKISIKKELDSEKEVGKVSPILFSLETRPELNCISEQVSFNKMLQDSKRHHSVFIYYYSAILYYLAKMMKSMPEMIKHHPVKFFFSGSGSKMLHIFTGGSDKRLAKETTDMFNHFLDGYEFPQGGETNIKIIFENKEPKQITAKGSITSKNENSQKIRDRITTNLEKCKSNFRLLDLPETLLKKKFTFNELSTDEVKLALYNEIKEFHQMLSTYFTGEHHHQAIQTDYVELSDEVIHQYINGEIKDELKKHNHELEYNDVPFFMIIKRIILEVLQKS